MSFAEFVVKVIEALVWPGVIVWLVWMFKQHFEKLLPYLYVKHKNWEAAFRLEKAVEEAVALPAPSQQDEAQAATPEELTRFDQLVAISPKVAILELRRELEGLVQRYAEPLIGPSNSNRPLSILIRTLRNLKLIDPSASAILDDLRVVGNSAAHSVDEAEFTKDDAHNYRDLVEKVRVLLAPGRPTIGTMPAA
jgi:hypothetical protein